ncbi:MAG: bifunctional diaminohydroxyphosphoribosylaminopyrimidine deaminase/5-amino-6-(5-phosphoribosylamino)uracil reductase RibD [Gammaproteobacteria bacterium]|nr:bifunctional diaminohydroxyphosphoribosylaminopyrimidine deaminase/5-amino-6-(5-phosphoribosylamino)uracil reductase RibD [Gammaproteobacteria bacterium]
MNDAYFMCKALALARRGLYTAHPNPRVGCVIARDGRVVGAGFHRETGGDHAEIAALREAGDAARGATAYLTLEPCAHHGRTPPCSEALARAGVARVVAAMEDPNPRVSGAGLAALRDAGIDTEVGLFADDARRLNRGFISRMTRRRPWVRIKSAISLDGRIALASGDSAWISGEASRRDVQFWRAQSGALLTGSGTVLHDDPRLSVRLSGEDLGVAGEVRQPMRVVVDGAMKTSPSAKIYAPGAAVAVAVCDSANGDSADGGANAASAPGDSASTAAKSAKHAEFTARGVEVLAFNGARHVPLAALLETLAGRFEINEVQVESGAGLGGALIEAGLCDELLLYLAPHLLGDGGRGLAEFGDIIESMDRRREFDYEDIRMTGKDIRILARPCPR